MYAYDMAIPITWLKSASSWVNGKGHVYVMSERKIAAHTESHLTQQSQGELSSFRIDFSNRNVCDLARLDLKLTCSCMNGNWLDEKYHVFKNKTVSHTESYLVQLSQYELLALSFDTEGEVQDGGLVVPHLPQLVDWVLFPSYCSFSLHDNNVAIPWSLRNWLQWHIFGR